MARTKLNDKQLEKLVSVDKVSGASLNITGSDVSSLATLTGGDHFLVQSGGVPQKITADTMSTFFGNVTVHNSEADEAMSILFASGSGQGQKIGADEGGALTYNPSSNLLIASGNVRAARLEIDSASDYLDVTNGHLTAIANEDLVLQSGRDVVLAPQGSGDVIAKFASATHFSPETGSRGTLGHAFLDGDYVGAPAGLRNNVFDQFTLETGYGNHALLYHATASSITELDDGTSVNQSSNLTSTSGYISMGMSSQVDLSVGDVIIASSSAGEKMPFLVLDSFGNGESSINVVYHPGVQVSGETMSDSTSAALVTLLAFTASSEAYTGPSIDEGAAVKISQYGSSNYFVIKAKAAVASGSAGIVYAPNGGSDVIDGGYTGWSSQPSQFGSSTNIGGTFPRSWQKFFVDNIDIDNAGTISLGGSSARLDLDADDDTSIRSSADDVIDFELGGTDRFQMTATAIVPGADDTYDLGSSALQWQNLYVNGAAHIDALGQDLDAGDFNLTNVNAITASAIQVQQLDVVTINSITQTETTLEISDKLIVSALSASVGNATGGGLKVGGGDDQAGYISVLFDSGSTHGHKIDFNVQVSDGGAEETQVFIKDGGFLPDQDDNVDLGGSSNEFKDLYLDGIAYMDNARVQTISSGSVVLASTDGDLVGDENITFHTDGDSVELQVTGNIRATNFYGDGSNLTGVGAATVLATGSNDMKIPFVNGVSTAATFFIDGENDGVGNLLYNPSSNTLKVAAIEMTGSTDSIRIGQTSEQYNMVVSNGTGNKSLIFDSPSGTGRTFEFHNNTFKVGEIEAYAFSGEAQLFKVRTQAKLALSGSSIDVSGSLIPQGTGDFADLGTATHAWQNLYLSGNLEADLDDLAVDVADSTHHILVQDSDDKIVKKESVGDLVTSMTGNGLQVTAGVLSITAVQDIYSSASKGTGLGTLSADLVTASLSQDMVSGSLQVYVNGMLQTPSGSVEGIPDGDTVQRSIYDYILVTASFTGGDGVSYTHRDGPPRVFFAEALDQDDVVQLRYLKQ